MSSGGEQPKSVWVEFRTQRKIDSCILRRRFLERCIEEKVIPKETPIQIKQKEVPFSDCAKFYLLEACEDLRNTVDDLRSYISGTNLPRCLLQRLEREHSEQSVRLEEKLAHLCDSSDWNKVEREDLIVNLSDHTLTDTEKQSLSLGLKFDIGLTEYVNKNYRWEDSDLEKGFKQSLITCFHALATSHNCAIPKRFWSALENLGNNDNLMITSADKGGGIVIMNKTDYVRKMYDLLSDTTTYEKKHKGHATIEGEKFKKEARRILVKSNRGALEAAKEVVNGMNEEDLPLSKGDYLKLISLCVKFGSFIFNNEEYFQCRGLAIGSPLSCVLASLYMEVLERDHFTNIMGQDTTWLRYVDDVLALTPWESDLSNKLNMLNSIETHMTSQEDLSSGQPESDKTPLTTLLQFHRDTSWLPSHPPEVKAPKGTQV
ncbi:uncharacterized protein LOC143037780 [Oratosquilla oratoria]|uniref:uncharacterized protein LOC143037780 n=1 Tax=Oratosquilla oratoria TaxID=337810 RepID=UPI003F7659E0